MSAILKELQAVTDLQKSRGQDEQEFLIALVRRISDLSDEKWKSLSVAAQDWFNEAADNMNAKKPLPAFPDAKADEEPQARTRRASPEKEETKLAATSSSAEEAKVGDDIKIITKRGKEVIGKVVEVTDDLIVIVGADGDEAECSKDRIQSLEIIVAVQEKKRRKSADEDDGPAVVEPKVGDEIKAITARDKEISGKVIEIEDDLLVIQVGEEELEITPSKLKSLDIVPAAEETKTRRKSADTPPDDKGKNKRNTAASNGGISATGRMRELIVDDMDAKMAEIDKILKKEGIQYRDNTLSLVYAETHKLIALMRARKLIK